MNRMFLTDDYFSDVNPRSMRRLMNVIYVMGRLLKAFKIDFNWHHLSVWVNISEQWPYRTSWLINYIEENVEDSIDLDTPLLNVYEKIKQFVPKKIDSSFNDMDRDENKLEIFLKIHKKTLTVKTIHIMYPFTINLDPYIKKLIKDYLNNREMMGLDIPEVFSKSHGLTGSKRSPLEWILQQKQNLNNSRTNFNSPDSSLKLIPYDFRHLPLSTLGVSQVGQLVSSVPGIVEDKKINYMNTIKRENINGKVLLNCELLDLKAILQMGFGDWELFKLVIIALRQMETDGVNQHLNENLKDKVKIKKFHSNINQNDSTLEQMILEREAVSDLVSCLNEDAKEDIENIDNETDSQSSTRNQIFLENTSTGNFGRNKSRSIPKLIVTEDEYKRTKDYLNPGSLFQRQRSKSENPPEFDEKEENDFFQQNYTAKSFNLSASSIDTGRSKQNKQINKKFYVDLDDD